MNYYELVRICGDISNKFDDLSVYLENTLTPLLYIITFAVFLKIGFSCLRGYKV